jgi:hypothetical protein
LSLEKLLDDYNAGKIPTERDMQEALMLAQDEIERLECLINELPPADMRVVVQIDSNPQKLRFSNIDRLIDHIGGL